MKATAPCLAGLLLLAAPVFAAPKDPVKAFEKALKRGNTTLIEEAAARLAESPTKKGVKSLVKYGALIESIDVYLACRDALAAATSGAARDELIKGLVASKRPESRVLCADALGFAPSAASVEALGLALDDRAKQVRIATIRSLKRIERRGCVPLLFTRLGVLGFNSGDAEAEELYGALFALTGQAYANVEDWQKWWETVKGTFDPKKRIKSTDDVTTLVRKGEGKIFDSEVRSQAFVLVLDISSSMRVIDLPPGETWKGPDKKQHKYRDPDPSGQRKPHPDSRFVKAREAFVKFIKGLSSATKFSIVTFGDKKDTKLWKKKPVPADARNKKAAIAYVKGLRWSPATRTDLALQEAFKVQDIDSIYLYSDGIPEKRKGGSNVRISQDEILELARTLNRTRKLKINCYAMASSKEMRGFLRKMAEENNGEYKDIRAHMR